MPIEKMMSHRYRTLVMSRKPIILKLNRTNGIGNRVDNHPTNALEIREIITMKGELKDTLIAPHKYLQVYR